MSALRRLAKLVYYKLKYSNLKVRISSDIGGSQSVFEGYNSIGVGSYFCGQLGYASYIGDNCHINASIGKYCSIGNNVRTISGRHPLYSCISTHPCFYSTSKQSGMTFVNEDLFDEYIYADEQGHSVCVGNDVWIGEGVTILEGVKIGNGVAIAAGAVVTNDIEPYSVVGGVPAKLIKKRFSDNEIEKLQKLGWWDNDVEWVREKAVLFNDVEAFFEEIDCYL